MSEPNNTEWLDNEIEDMLLRHLLWITSKNPEKGDFDILPHKLAITAKINEMQTESYKKGYIQRGLDELRKYENDKG